MHNFLPRGLYYLLNSGKNSKLAYYAGAFVDVNLPHKLLAWRLQHELRKLKGRKDKDYISQRVNYYNRLTDDTPFDTEKFLKECVELQHQKITGQKVYYLDSFRYAKSFPLNKQWVLLPGDVVHVPDVPSVVKSRPLIENNANSVLMKLDRVRHFLFVNDRKPFSEKQNMAIFRGLIGQDGGPDLKRNRFDFVKQYFGHPMCNVGVIDKQYPEWCTEKLTIDEHLNYKFVMALEGNDVASNLKWVMSSNSIAVMPKPTCETWFMEGTLRPNYHYIEIRPDFADLEERLNYYISHPDEAENIVQHAHEYVAQFRNARREQLISLLVLKKYFDFIERRLSVL